MSPDENSAQLKPAEASTPALESPGLFPERGPQISEVTPEVARRSTRRAFLAFGTSAIAGLGVAASQLPPSTLERLGLTFWPHNQWLLNNALRFDDYVAEFLYSPNPLMPTYTKSQITPLKNNYKGVTPDSGYIPMWHLTLHGLPSGLAASPGLRNPLTRFS